MPTISRFYGIKIQMFFDDKHSPHFHARYSEFRALIDIETGAMVAGKFPNRAYKLVQEWARLHRAELHSNWERARNHEELIEIEPLE